MPLGFSLKICHLDSLKHGEREEKKTIYEGGGHPKRLTNITQETT